MPQAEQCHVFWKKELAKDSRQRQGRGKVVNGAQVRVHMQIVVEVLHSAKVCGSAAKAEKVNVRQ